MEYIFEKLAGLAIIFILIYYYLTWNFDFWSKRGVSGPKPILLFGTVKDVKLNKIFMADYLMEQYQKYKNEPMFGIFSKRQPILILKDPEMIKNVLIKDFSSFMDRGLEHVAKVEPLNEHLFFVEHEIWRPLRVNLSPVFTANKLKGMFYLLMEVADQFEQYLDRLIKKEPVVECRDLTAKFTTDVISVCAFGLNSHSIADDDSIFRKHGRKSFNMTIGKMLKLKIREEAIWLYELLGPLVTDHEKNNFFIDMVTNTMEYRKKNNIKTNDVIDLVMQIRDNPNKVMNMEMTDSFTTAQVYAFFIAGFETSSSTISNALYELAQNQLVQDKLREEIISEYQNNNGSLTFESIKRMEYMHKVFCETLRKYPPIAMLNRRTVKEYTFPETNVTIPKGTKVWVPVYAIQRDPEIYPNPEVFDPERFNEENIKQRHPSHFLSFGDGPRNCIGSRFANYQVKVGLCVILKNYKVEVCDKTRIPYKNNPRSPILILPIDGIVLKFTRIC